MNFYLKYLGLIVLLHSGASAANYYDCANGNSHSSSTWAASSNGACGAGIPGSADSIFIGSHTVTVNVNLVAATVTVSGSGKLVIAGGVAFESSGDITLNPASQANTCSISGSGGSSLKFDTRIHGTATYNYSSLCFTGTAGNRAKIQGGAGGLQFDNYGGGITLAYTDVNGVGSSTHHLTTVWTSAAFPTGDDINITYSTFTGCGLIGNVGGGSVPDGASWIESYNVWSSSVAYATAVPEFPISFTSGTRSVTFNVYDKPWGGDIGNGYGSIDGFTITDNYFGGGFAAGGAAAAWQRNFVRTSTEDGSSPGLAGNGLTGSSSFQNSYTMRDDAYPAHEWGITNLLATSANNTISGNILDSTAVSNIIPGLGNDGLVNDSTTPGQTVNYSYNISVMGSDGYGIGTLADTVSAYSNIVNIDHNTGIPTPYGSIEYELEMPPAGVGNRGSITNNIVIDPNNAAAPVNFMILQSHCPPLTNVITDAWNPTAIHHNGIYGLALSQAACAAAFTNEGNSAAGAWSSTPNAVGLVQANPNFTDYTRSVVSFDSEYLGNSYTTWTSNTAYAQGTCVTLAQAGFYENKPLNYCAKAALTGSEANSKPGTGTSSRTYWEWASLTHIRAAMASGATITDSSLGLSGATYIQALVAWVRAGFAPTNAAYHGTASDGSDIGAVAYTGPVMTVSGIQVDDVSYNGGHSCARLTWNSSMAPDNQQIQYGPTTSYGNVTVNYSPGYSMTGQQVTVCGNTPGSTVHFCPQSHNSTGWSSCAGVDQVVTFPEAPANTQPALPNTTPQPYPDTTGFAIYYLDSTCSNWDSVWDSASTHAAGSIIYLPAGQTCTGNFVIEPANEGSGGVQPISPANVNTTTGTFTLKNHGFALNQTVYLDAFNYLNPPASDAIPTGFSAPPTMYYVVNPTTNTFQLSAAAGGSPIIPTGTGYGSEWIAPTSMVNTVPIVLRSSAADSALPPPGVRIDPASYAGSFGVLQSSNAPAGATVLVEPFAHHVHIGPGIEITSTPYFASQTNHFDSPVQKYLWYQYFNQGFSSIAFDRVWLHGQPCPDRTAVGLGLDGSNIEVDSSVLDNIAVCRPNYAGLGTTVTGPTISIASGTYYFLTATQNVASGISASVGGAATGTVFVTLPTGSSTPKVYVPSGATISCKGCTGVVATLSDFPRDGNGRLSEGPIASIGMSGGVLGTPSMAQDQINISFVADTPAGGNAEGGSAIDTVFGPGPARVTNNYFHNDIGIAYFIEDTGAALGYSLADYLTYRNTFLIDNAWSPSNAAWNNLTACNRNIYESKTGAREQVTGNILTGQFGYCTPQGMSILLASNNAQESVSVPPVASMSDLTATYNTISNGSGGITMTGTSPGAPRPHVTRRALIQNNILYNLNAWQHTSVFPSNPHQTPGWCLYLGFGGEDWTVDHNTCYAIGGYSTDAVQWEWSKQEGVKITNNMFVNIGQDFNRNIIYSEGNTANGILAASPSCYNLSGKAAMDCSLTPGYSFLGNVMAAGYTNSQSNTGDSPALMGGAYSGVDPSNSVRAESTVAARVAAMGFRNPASGDLRLTYNSNYAGNAQPGTDGRPMGADLDAADQAQGKILNLRALSITSTGAVLYFEAPDAGAACYIKTGIGGDLTTYATTPADTTANRLRSIAVSGLHWGTQYLAYAMCAGASNTPSVSFATN